LGGAFREEKEDDEDDGGKQRQQAQRRDVQDALQGGADVVVVHGSPEAPIIGDDRGKGEWVGSVADDRITDGARTLAMTERGICRDGNDYERLKVKASKVFVRLHLSGWLSVKDRSIHHCGDRRGDESMTGQQQWWRAPPLPPRMRYLDFYIDLDMTCIPWVRDGRCRFTFN